MLPCSWTIQAAEGLGELLIPPLISPARKQGSKGICQGPPVSPTSKVPPAAASSSSVTCFHSAAQVSPLTATVGSKHSEGSHWV